MGVLMALATYLGFMLLVSTYAASPNLALYKDAYQSTTFHYNWPAGGAVDGRITESDSMGSCSHTRIETEPFWIVDLGQVYRIGHVRVTNRENAKVYDRLKGFILGFRTAAHDMTSRIFREDELCHIHDGAPGAAETVTVTCYIGGPTHARYVYVYLPGGHRILSLCEVAVYGLVEKTARLYADLNNPCLQPPMSPIPNKGSFVTHILQDSKYDTCIRPSEMARSHVQAVMPLLSSRRNVRLSVVGEELACSPLSGLAVTSIGGCSSGICNASACVPSNHEMTNGMKGCLFRCHCPEKCTYIVVDVTRLADTTSNWDMCEIKMEL